MLNLNNMSHHRIEDNNDGENKNPITICSPNAFKDSDFLSWYNVYTNEKVDYVCLNHNHFAQKTSFWGQKLGNSWINP